MRVVEVARRTDSRSATTASEVMTDLVGAVAAGDVLLVHAGVAQRANAERRAMRYVDEYRDAELGRALATEIVATVEPGRHYKVMEVCGGHTHTIYKYGVDDLLPANVELVHGPGCPVCVIPMGRVDDGIAVARRPEVIFTCFGDMMRVPGGDGTLLEAKAEGADVRMVYSPLDALRIARENPDREVVFFAVGFETTAPSTALTLHAREGRARPELLRLLQPRHDRAAAARAARVARPAPRRLRRPRPRLDRRRRAAVRVHPGATTASPSSSPASSRSTCSSRCTWCSPARRGALRGREPVHARRPVRRQPAGAAACSSEVFELRPHFEWRGLGFIPRSGLQAVRGLRRLRRRAALRRAGRPRRRPEGMSVRRGPEGRDQAVGVQGLRHRLHARAADRHLHGVVGGRLRRLLQLRPVRARTARWSDGHPRRAARRSS